jgi:hypothetical protein
MSYTWSEGELAAQAGDVSSEVLDNMKTGKDGRVSSTVKGK